MLESFLHQCSVDIIQNKGVIFTIFMAGFLGSLTHCSAMCAPFVIMQTTKRMDNIPSKKMNEISRLKAAALTPYHFGRMTTYTLLGVIASVLASPVLAIGEMQKLAAIMLCLAAVAIFLSSFNINIKLPRIINISAKISKIANPLFRNPTGLKGYGLGVCLGFIPCGLLFSVFMIVATIKNPFVAAFAMVVFCFATIPSLFFISYTSSFAATSFKKHIKKTAQFLLILNSFYLFYLSFVIISP